MGSVKYKNQPAIDKTKGKVPLDGTAYIYTVSKILWPREVENFLSTQLVGFSLHVCCGKSKLGNVRLDLYERDVNVTADMYRLPFDNQTFDTVLIDPPYNSKMHIMHGMLEELSRVSRRRIIFQHWFVPMNKYYKYRKDHNFELVGLYNWMPKTYFGRIQAISIFDKEI